MAKQDLKKKVAALKRKGTQNKDVKEMKFGKFVLRNIILALSLLIISLVFVQLMLGVYTRHGKNKDVPNFVGSTIEQAKEMAREGRLEIILNDSLYVPKYAGGIILEQQPVAGEDKVKSKRKIYVTINAFKQRKANIPYVAGFSLRQAKSNLQTAGFEIDRLEYVEDIANDYVLGQKYKGYDMFEGDVSQAELGSGITLVVGYSDDEPVALPNLNGMTLKEAKNTIWENGFNIGNIAFDDDLGIDDHHSARVYYQYPKYETSKQLGSNISIKLQNQELYLQEQERLELERIELEKLELERLEREREIEQAIERELKLIPETE